MTRSPANDFAGLLWLFLASFDIRPRRCPGALSNVLVPSQLENKRFRGLSAYFGVDREWEAQWRKGRKTSYRGKPTRWYARLLKLEQQAAAPALLAMLNG